MPTYLALNPPHCLSHHIHYHILYTYYLFLHLIVMLSPISKNNTVCLWVSGFNVLCPSSPSSTFSIAGFICKCATQSLTWLYWLREQVKLLPWPNIPVARRHRLLSDWLTTSVSIVFTGRPNLSAVWTQPNSSTRCRKPNTTSTDNDHFILFCRPIFQWNDAVCHLNPVCFHSH